VKSPNKRGQTAIPLTKKKERHGGSDGANDDSLKKTKTMIQTGDPYKKHRGEGKEGESCTPGMKPEMRPPTELRGTGNKNQTQGGKKKKKKKYKKKRKNKKKKEKTKKKTTTTQKKKKQKKQEEKNTDN